MEEKKYINEGNLRKENRDLLERVMAGIRRRMQVHLQRNEGYIEGNGN